ncbi:Ubiquinone biosynthesis protein coq9, mitochondrial [Tolypocladium ophioglossoides CBS 100239]|uniref:Ubiquinone biosynthesis protein n=1 Tax=Tolypocladium ophioglossoides (strain CBS 100239) TaxID=1163406 RepID=A0A0L0NGQ9_TOLOC|nr:Ubiquinone biosynthesis protein coq9, mitochondrial [Tolypocladium ophioglossoides CBS 100239]
MSPCSNRAAAAPSLLASAARMQSAALGPGSPRRRPFHSYDHPSAEGPFGAVEDSILAAAYRHVPEHGFSQRALGLGARDAGFLDISPSVLPDGPFSLIRHHLVAQRQALASWGHELFDGQARDKPAMGVGAKVAGLTWARLMANKHVIHRWQEVQAHLSLANVPHTPADELIVPQALAIMAQPSYVPASLKELALLSDEIWFLAGDKAVDPSWYSKRASLSMIYSTTELFMTNDKSPGFTETRSFLNRRLGEVKTVGGVIGSLGQWAGFTMKAGVNVLRSKGARI